MREHTQHHAQAIQVTADSEMQRLFDLSVQQGREIDRLRAQRNELRDALQAMLAEAEDFHTSTGHGEPGSCQCDAMCALMPKARAAIAKALGLTPNAGVQPPPADTGS